LARKLVGVVGVQLRSLASPGGGLTELTEMGKDLCVMLLLYTTVADVWGPH
jgi:hypothetical protein